MKLKKQLKKQLKSQLEEKQRVLDQTRGELQRVFTNLNRLQKENDVLRPPEKPYSFTVSMQLRPSEAQRFVEMSNNLMSQPFGQPVEGDVLSRLHLLIALQMRAQGVTPYNCEPPLA